MLDQRTLIPLALSCIAGLSTVLGAFVVFFSKSSNKKLITFALGFSAGVMITVSFTDLFPAAEEALSKAHGNIKGLMYTLIFLLIGSLMAFLIDKFIPENNETGMLSSQGKNQNLYRIGLFSMIAIMIHNFPEGIATFVSGYEDISLGIYITIAIMLHNIPEGISIAIPIYCSTNKKGKAFLYTFISGIAEPIGALITLLFLRSFISEILLGITFAIVCGIMLYIAFEELLPGSIETNHKGLYLVSVFLGILIIPISHLVIH